MTRPTSLSDEIPTLTHFLGRDPLTISAISSNSAVDRAAGIDVFVPPSDGNIALVQSKYGESALGGNVTVAFDDAPAVGNLMVAAIAGRDIGGSSLADTAGWTAHSRGTDHTNSSGTRDGIKTMFRVVESGDTGLAYAPVISTGGTMVLIAEFSGVTELDDSAGVSNAGTSNRTNPINVGTVTPTSGRSALIFGAMAAIHGDSTSITVTPDGNSTELRDDSLSSVDHPLLWAAYRIVATTSGSYTVSGDTSTAGLDHGGQSFAFSTSGNFVNGGPNATDGSDSTYVGPFDEYQIDLGDAYQIVRTRLRLAWENAGSRTVTIYGANVVDFSDEVQLESESVTATGSWTAQDVTLSWADAGSFRYFRVTLSVAARLHTWQLYEANVGESHTHEYVPESIFDAPGDLLVGTGADAYQRFPSVGSNSRVLTTKADGTLEWGLNVRSIVSNGSNTLTRPDLALASGTGIAFAVASNQLTISSTVSGGGAAGVTAVAHASNTFSGTVTLTTPGDTVGITSPTAGTFALTAAGGSSGGAGASGVTVEDDGSQEGTGVTTLDFAGAGVSVSVAGAEATVTIPGGSTPALEPDPEPHASDDEMSVTDTTDPITDWTTLGTLDALNRNSTAPGHLYMRKAAVNATRVDGVYKSITLADGEAFVAKMTDATHIANFNRAGIFIGIATPGRIDTCAIVWNNGPQGEVLAMTNPTTLSGTVVATAVGQVVPTYFAIRRNSATSYDYLVSRSGRLWMGLSLARDPSITQATVGLFVNPQSASRGMGAAFDWARIYTTLPGVVI